MIPTDLLVSAYARGWFPMAGEDGEVRWYSPDPRGIIPLNALHVPRRLKRVVSAGTFRIEIDRDFTGVIRACAESQRDTSYGASPTDDPGTWINPEILESYVALHDLGLAHSIEAWQGDQLAGGLYGVALGGAFFGESMFHRVTDASKVALVGLTEHLNTRGYRLLDIQWVTDHLVQFGAIEIPKREYLRRLEQALEVDAIF